MSSLEIPADDYFLAGRNLGWWSVHKTYFQYYSLFIFLVRRQ